MNKRFFISAAIVGLLLNVSLKSVSADSSSFREFWGKLLLEKGAPRDQYFNGAYEDVKKAQKGIYFLLGIDFSNPDFTTKAGAIFKEFMEAKLELFATGDNDTIYAKLPDLIETYKKRLSGFVNPLDIQEFEGRFTYLGNQPPTYVRSSTNRGFDVRICARIQNDPTYFTFSIPSACKTNPVSDVIKTQEPPRAQTSLPANVVSALDAKLSTIGSNDVRIVWLDGVSAKISKALTRAISEKNRGLLTALQTLISERTQSLKETLLKK